MNQKDKRRLPYQCIGFLTIVAANHPKGAPTWDGENPWAVCGDVMTGLVMALEQIQNSKRYTLLTDEDRELIESALKGQACYTLSRPYGGA